MEIPVEILPELVVAIGIAVFLVLAGFAVLVKALED